MQEAINYKLLFINLAESKGYKILKPNYQQKKSNIDFILEGQNQGKATRVTVDLKKKNSKNSNSWVYIEFENSKGEQGWIYGSCDFIVFETGSNFIFVPRKQLINYLSSNSLVRWDLPYVDKPWASKYRLFRRNKTLETITQIQVKDLLNIKNHKIWPKP